MIHLGFLLHLHQPPNQLKRVLDRAVTDCYSPLFDLINSRNDARFTVNLNWSLTELLLNNGFGNILSKIKLAMNSGVIEMTGTAAYHAILPLIPYQEQVRQIKHNHAKNLKALGKAYKPNGVFPPELAFGHEIIDSIKECSYKWTITDDQPFNCIHNQVPWNYIPRMEGLPILLRSNLWSYKVSMENKDFGQRYSGREVIDSLINKMNNWWEGKDGYIIIALNGETFGYHVPGYIDYFLKQMLDTLKWKKDQIKLSHLSEIVRIFPKIKKEVPPGSWSTNDEDFWSGNFFPLWKNKYNNSHALLWELANLALASVKELEETLDKSLSSSTFWWANKKDRKISPLTLKSIQMLVDVIKHAQPDNLERAREIEE